MARSLHFPADLNLENPRPLAPQWMVANNHDATGSSAPINSALALKEKASHVSQGIFTQNVEKPAGGNTGQKPGGWGADETQGHKQERDTWRADKESLHPWNSPLDNNHQPGQQDRFAPQLGRPRPPPALDATPTPKNAERWRDDGQSRWGHTGGQNDHGPNLPRGSPGRGANHQAAGENWGRQRLQRPEAPGGPINRADGRWGGNNWGQEEHPRPGWDAGRGGGIGGPGVAEHGRDAPGAGRGRGFNHFGRGRPIGKEAGPSFQRWPPGTPAQSPAQEQPVTRGEDFIVPKLGTGPQRHKYTVEQLLTTYVSLSESGGLIKQLDLVSFADHLPDESTRHQLLTLLEAIASQMVEAGFASKAERRLASKLNNLLEASAPAPAQPEEPKAEALKPEEKEEDPLVLPSDIFKDIQKKDSPFASEAHKVHAPAVPDAAAGQDQWYYLDPAAKIQGPYKRQQIEEWHESGFFPLDLPLSQTNHEPKYRTLQEVLKMWKSGVDGQQAKDVSASKADSLLVQQHSVQSQQTAASTAGSQRLEPREASIDKEGQDWTTAQRPAPQLPPERPASHPYLEPQLHGHGPSPPRDQQNFHNIANFGQPMSQQLQQHSRSADQQSALATLNAQLSSMGIQLPESSQDQTQEHLLRVIQEQAGKRDSGQQHSLLSRLQENQPVHQQHFQAPATDPIIDLLTSISGNAGHANAPGHLPPIGSNMRPGFPQPAPFQPQPQHQDHHQPQPYHHQQNHHQSQNQHQQPMYSTHLGLQDILGVGQSFPMPNQQQHDQPSFSQFHPSIPRSAQQQNLPFEAGHHSQQMAEPQMREQLNMNATFGRWLPQNQQVQPQHQPPPPQPKSLPPREVQADKFKPSPPPAPQRSVVDEILSPSQLAPPPAAAVGPPPRKLSTAGSLEQPAPPNEAAPFQKVQRHRKKESEAGAKGDPLLAPPVKAQPPAAVPEKKAPQELARPTQTLAEAAGLKEVVSNQELESAPAPWSSVHPGSNGKSILDIQREEALQAKRRAAQEAVTEAERAAAASSAPSQAAGGWGKSVLRPSAPAAPSFAEIQEQERKRVTSNAPPPPAVPSGAPPTWTQAPPRSSVMAERGQPDRVRAQEPHKRAAQPVAPSRAAAPKTAAQKLTGPKAPRPAASKPAEELDDNMFWDPVFSANPPKMSPAPNIAAERKVNGAASARPPPSPEKAAVDTSGEDGFDSLSPEFANWCKIHLRKLRNGDDDLTLVQYLMTVSSNAEIAEYMTEYLGKTPAVSTFSKEFIMRKLAEQNGRKKGKSGRKATAAQPSGAVGVAPITSGGATGWSKMPKKKKKGQKVDINMLGFATGTNYAALEKLES